MVPFHKGCAVSHKILVEEWCECVGKVGRLRINFGGNIRLNMLLILCKGCDAIFCAFAVLLCVFVRTSYFMEQSYMHAFTDDLHMANKLQIHLQPKTCPKCLLRYCKSLFHTPLCQMPSRRHARSQNPQTARAYIFLSRIISEPTSYHGKTGGACSTNVNIAHAKHRHHGARLALTSTKLLPQSQLGKVSAQWLIGSGASR